MLAADPVYSGPWEVRCVRCLECGARQVALCPVSAPELLECHACGRMTAATYAARRGQSRP